MLSSETQAVANMTSLRAIDGDSSYHSRESFTLGMLIHIRTMVEHRRTGASPDRQTDGRPEIGDSKRGQRREEEEEERRGKERRGVRRTGAATITFSFFLGDRTKRSISLSSSLPRVDTSISRIPMMEWKVYQDF